MDTWDVSPSGCSSSTTTRWCAGASPRSWRATRGSPWSGRRHGAEALARVPALRPDVAVLDVRLPDGDGVTCAASALRAARAAVPDAHQLHRATRRCSTGVMAGASGYLLKQIRAGTGVGGPHRRGRRPCSTATPGADRGAAPRRPPGAAGSRSSPTRSAPSSAHRGGADQPADRRAHVPGREDGEELRVPPAREAGAGAAYPGGGPRHGAARPRWGLRRRPVKKPSGAIQRDFAAFGARRCGCLGCSAPPLGAVGQVGQPAAHGHRRQAGSVVGDGDPDLVPGLDRRSVTVTRSGARVAHHVGDELPDDRDQVGDEVCAAGRRPCRGTARPALQRCGPRSPVRTTSVSCRRIVDGSVSSASCWSSKIAVRISAIVLSSSSTRLSTAVWRPPRGRSVRSERLTRSSERAGGEDALDDVVVQVAGDPVPIGLQA